MATADSSTLLSGIYGFPSVIVAEDIDTVPPLDMADAKFKLPLPTAASPSTMTVDGDPLTTVFNRNDAGVPDARPASDVIAENVKSPADEPAAAGFESGRLASLVPGSAAKTPAVLPVGDPVNTSITPVVPRAVVIASRRVSRSVSL
jgi:hypothetical protein